MDLIISHKSCPDGWLAAYIAKKKYPDAEILLLDHGIDPMPVIGRCAGLDVIMLDYSLRTRELNDLLNDAAKSFHIYDHHKTAQAALEGANYATFDMKRSGAGLAWDYFFGKDNELWEYFEKQSNVYFSDVWFMGRPWWVNFTEDQDLWNWALPSSQEINAFLMVQPRTIEVWDSVIKLSETEAANRGRGVRQYIEYYTRSVVEHAQEGILNFEDRDYKTAVLNIPYAGVSEAGSALVKDGKYDIALLWFERGDGITQFSLRSNKDESNVDVSAIAKSFNGGGHHNAAGFQIPLAEGRAIVDKVLNRNVSKVRYLGISRSPGGCV